MSDFTRRAMLKGCAATSAVLLSPAMFALQKPEASDAQREQVLDLSGNWRFYRDDEARGLGERWYLNSLPTGLGPQGIHLPGTTDEAHAGHTNPEAPSLSGLYRKNVYAGPAWYQREIDIPVSWRGKSLTLFLERVHWTTHAWIDGRPLGTQESLVAPHLYDFGIDVAPGKHLLTVCVDNTLLYDLGRFVSVSYEGTQTNWNGIIGRLQIIARDAVQVHGITVFPDIDRKVAKVQADVRNAATHSASGTVSVRILGPDGQVAGTASAPFAVERGSNKSIPVEVQIHTPLLLWDEFTPHLYTAEASVTGSHGEPERVRFGMRKLGMQGKRFTLNGRPLMLRGTLECGIFPLTGYPPTDVDSWRRIFQTEKLYGLNFIRFHSWTPPQAAFEAADIEGIFVQTEGPQANVETGEVPARDAFVERELLRIVATYGNYPSFALMAVGNEFGGSREVITEWVDHLMKADARHFYTSATSNKLKVANRQWTEDASMRGVHGPGTQFDYDEPMALQDRPFIGHELAQWTYYPDLDEQRKYTGVLEARNFEIVRNDLAAKGMLDQARLFLEASGKQAILLYKDEIECIMRTRDYAGFSLLDIHDYPGQGTALIGFLDPFWDSKGLIRPAEHQGYAGATVPLVRMPRRTYTSKETFKAEVEVAHFGVSNLASAQLEWSLTNESGVLVGTGTLPTASLKTGELSKVGEFAAPLDRVSQAAKLNLSVSIRDTSIANKWDIWVYPEQANVSEMPADVAVFSQWGPEVRAALEAGKKVVLFQRTFRASNALKGSFKPVFWSPIWFESDPATLGILTNPDHPIFSGFPTDIYSNWQWFHLIEGSASLILDRCPADLRPLVQVVDNFARNHRLATVFEAKVAKGRLLVCTLNLERESPEKQTPEQKAMLASIAAYVGSPLFAPQTVLNPRLLNEMLVAV